MVRSPSGGQSTVCTPGPPLGIRRVLQKTVSPPQLRELTSSSPVSVSGPRWWDFTFHGQRWRP